MKKLILLFTIAAFTLASCSSDDEASSSDPLIGTWTFFQSFFNGVEIPLDECDEMDTITVSANGAFMEEYYFNDNGTCVLDVADTGLWENRGNNIYEITYGKGTPEEEVLLVTITFSNNTFEVETTDGTDTYREVFIRN